MCILCVVQRWSRRVATMLPWLVIPLIVLWALSQLLPPALRFEITSPRLACVAVLLATLFWYEILMPHLSSWRAHRAARLRERRRTEALELQKRRKTATRHCRNCHLPYRNQTPGGGRFMCSYCGHISKKPVLGPTAGRGMIGDYVGKHGWLCDADGNCNSVGSVPKYWSGSDHRCSAEMSYSGVMVFSCKLLSFFFWSMRWLCGKFFRLGLSQEDRSCDLDHRGSSGKGEIAGNFKESRGEKARRKAEEKRQARLEKEMLEEEERKQKEDVARLVEERRRLRDQKMVAEKDRSKGSSLDGDRDDLKEIDRKRDRRKDKDKSSCKSNSDGEELEKRTSWQNERKHEFLKKGENERFDLQKNMAVNCKSHALHGVYESKVSVNKPRYFDGMKGTLLSSSRGFGDSSFFGRNTQKSASAAKSVKPSTGFVDHAQNTVKRRDAVPVSYVGKSASGAGENAYEASLTQPAATDAQPKTVCKMSWHQLFTRSSAVSPDPDSNPITYKTEKLLARGDQQSRQNFLPGYCKTYNQVQFGKASPFVGNRPTSTLFISNPISHVVPETTFPPLKVPLQSSVSEDADLFEDPCHVPDPMSLLGPVSESLDNFPLDLESEFAKTKAEQYPLLNSVYASAEMNKPLPIESPLSKLHLPEEIHTKSGQFFRTPRPDVSTNRPEQSTWQMWGNPWSQDGLGLVGSPSSLFPIVGHNNSQLQDDVLHSLPHKPIRPLISNNHNIQHVHANNHQQIGGACSHLGPSLNGNGIWLKNSPFHSPLQVYEDDSLLPLNLMDDITHSEATYSSPNKSTAVNSFETQQAFSWPHDDLVSHAPQEAVNLNSGSANVVSLFSRGPDAPSLWSFNQ